MLSEIQNVLRANYENVFYGAVDKDIKIWDYIVFARDRDIPGENKNSFTSYYSIALVREGYIEEGLPREVFAKLKAEIPGIKITENIIYDYTRKAGTNEIIEIASFKICKADK